MNTPLLDKSIKILLLVLLSVAVLYYGKSFLVPLLMAALLSMLVLPLCMRLEKKTNKAIAVILSVLVLLGAVAIIVSIVSAQVADISDNAEQIERNISEKVKKVQVFITKSLGIPEQRQQEIIQQQQQSSSGKMASFISWFFSSLGALLTNFIIVLVYIFLFLYFRDHLKRFILNIVPHQEQENTRTILHDVRRVAQKYLTGLAIMIACLWVMYGIGFSIIGVKHALFYAVLCGLLEIVPFVGNLTGVTITAIMSLAQGGSSSLLIGIIVTYGIVQFTQSYILEPLVVGRGISIHPVFTIIGIVGGEQLWGISGMILALPLLGIIKIICDHIEPLKPFGYLIGSQKKGKKDVVEKVKKIF